MKALSRRCAAVAMVLFLLLQEKCCAAFAPALSIGTQPGTKTVASPAPVARRQPVVSVLRPQQPIPTRVRAAAEDEATASGDVQYPSIGQQFPVVLAALDLLSLVVFAAVGKASHAADGSLDFVGTALTAAPFVASWYLTAPVTGVYGALDAKGAKDVAVASLDQTVKGWALAVPSGCAARGIIKGYVPPLPFLLVTLVATLVILGVTRALYAVTKDALLS